MSKKRWFLLLPVLCLFSPVFSQEVYLTEAEYQTLFNIITRSKANSEKQTALIAGLKAALRAQEAELNEALNTLKQSETDLKELNDTLSRIRFYSTGLSEYCKTLEKEKARLKKSNAALKIGAACEGAAVVILFLVCLL